MTLYHYCSSASFLSIIDSKSIRLSMLDRSNDEQEGRWIANEVESQLHANACTKAHSERLMRAINFGLGYLRVSGMCFSEHADQVSQWRGYADEAHGFAIGFDPAYLTELGKECSVRSGFPFALQRVRYDIADYAADIANVVGELARAIEASGDCWPEPGLSIVASRPSWEALHTATNATVVSSSIALMLLAHSIKNPAFSSEAEWRVISFHHRGSETSIEKTCQFRSSRDGIIPYRVIPLGDSAIAPIESVIIGPKNRTSVQDVVSVLKKNGFENVRTIRSAASYR